MNSLVRFVGELAGGGRRVLLIVWCCLLCCNVYYNVCWSQQTVAGPQSIATGGEYLRQVILPDTPAGATSTLGYSASIGIRLNENARYFAVDVTLRSPAVTTLRRDLVLRVSPIDGHFPAANAVASELPIPFSQGVRTESYQLSLPKWTHGLNYRLELLEDGAVVPDGRVDIDIRSRPFRRRAGLSALTDASHCDFLFLGDNIGLNGRFATLTRNSLNRFSPLRWSESSYRDLTNDWRLLQHIEVLIVNESDLKTPGFQSRQQVIRDWLMMGGIMIVQNASGDPNLAEQLNVRLRELPLKQPFRTYVQDAIPILDGLRAQAISQVRQQTQYFDAMVRAQATLPNNPAGGSQTPQQQEQLKLAKEWADHLMKLQTDIGQRWFPASLFSAGRGTVVSIPGGSIETPVELNIVQRFIGAQQSPTVKRGVDPLLGDVRFGRWMIPGVAEPPVYSFIGLLAVFVVLVGPVAYRWTSRSERSHLMFLIAPVLAGLTTVAMFTYSILADGFGTKLRVRQITWVDGKSGDAVERTRATLFAGASPRNGVSFPADAEVYPYKDVYLGDWRDQSDQVSGIRYRVSIDQEHQRFNRLLLPARTQQQFVWHKPRHKLGIVSLGSLPPKQTTATQTTGTATAQPKKRIIGSPFDNDPTIDRETFVEVKSTLPFDVQKLVVRSEDGRYWITRELPAGGTSQAFWMSDETRASAALGELYNDHRPIETLIRGNSNSTRANSDLIVSICRDINRNLPVITDGNFENALNRYLSVSGDLDPGVFVCLSQPSEDSIAVEGAEVRDSVRYVWGTLGE